ncbi:MAG: PAS domain S-box protein, partial [Cypionkella sp.]
MAFAWSSFGLNAPRDRLFAGAAAILVFVVMAIGITALARQALDQIRILNTASSDNLQWTLSQTEVEFLLYYNAILHAASNPAKCLSDVRRRFDIFYSRIDTIRHGPIYGSLAVKPQMAEEFAHLDAFVVATIPHIDGPDDALRAQLPRLISEAASLRGDIRAISLEGIRVFSEIADLQRQSVSETMQRIALLTVSLILLLLLALFLLARIYGTTRRQAVENKAVRERLQAMLNTSLDAVLVVDRNGRFIEFNGAATEIFGYTAQEALGQEMTKLIFAEHMIAAHNAGMKRHLETGAQRVIGAGRVQVEAKRKSGEVFPVELSVAKTMSPAGEIFVSYLRDISDRMRAEEHLTKARDDALAGERAKARFMAVMSHEMRTPLNGLLGALDLLRSTPLTAKQREFTEVMQKTGALLLHHVSDVLDISRLESGKVGPLSGYVSGSWIEGDLWRGPGTIDRKHYEGKLRWDIGEATSLTFQTVHNYYFDYDSPSITKAQYFGNAGDLFGR